MTVTNTTVDPETLTMTMVSRFTAPPATVWRLWDDPRLLERWWGPPTYPATFTEHAMTAGGGAKYFMTGPDGDHFHGWWRVIEVDPPNGFRMEDGFANADGTPNDDMPISKWETTLAPTEDGSGTTMTVVSTFASHEALEQLIAMGMKEGATESMNQMDAILVELVAADGR